MVKNKKNQTNLGRSLVINNKRNWNTPQEFSDRHTDDPSKTQSITENTSLNDYFYKTKLANKKFEAKQENIIFIDKYGLHSPEEEYLTKGFEKELLIPRRPKLDQNPISCTTEKLKELENENYLKWRKKLAYLQENENIILTPFEKNLEFWRQLWRVIERSDIVVQILDARNPLMFYCEDLERYIKEVDIKKVSIILLNKSDYLTSEQRNYWFKYFSSISKNCVFFSALEQQQSQIDQTEDDFSKYSENYKLNNNDLTTPLTYNELIYYLKLLRIQISENKSKLTVGFVGYPNVGKSSTINALLRAKRVSVSANPGKTKHFQTMILDDELTICDCPGLVFPNIVSSKAEMIINGILPIDQIKDVNIAINAVTSKIPAHIFESLYGIILKKPGESDEQNPSRKVDPMELLTVYGYSRGFMTQRGLPDTSKAAKFILKDFVNGKILFCYAPPNVEQEKYHKYIVNNQSLDKKITDRKLIKICEGNDLIVKDFDQEFFHGKFSSLHIKDPRDTDSDVLSNKSKPWKKHKKRNKKEKLRRVYAYLDK